MKKILILFLASVVVVLTSCRKEEIKPFNGNGSRSSTYLNDEDFNEKASGDGSSTGTTIPGGGTTVPGGEVTDPNDDSILRKPRKN